MITGKGIIAAAFDARAAHPARVYDYWLGGKDNFAADREAGDQVIAVRPGIVTDIRANRDFLIRSVRHLAAECGIRQFLDIGSGIPTAPNVHEVAQAAAPDCRVVYIDADPLVLVHSRALLASSPEGATAYVDADLREPEHILRAAAETLDLCAPVAILLVGVLHLIADEDQPHDIVARLVSRIPSGSYMSICHPASDIQPEIVAAAARTYNHFVAGGQVRRDHADVFRFFRGLDLTDPGLVQCHRWKPDPDAGTPQGDVSAWAAVARKP
jgi:hypothetical protein